MSLIEEYSQDLDSLAALLTQWIAHSGETQQGLGGSSARLGEAEAELGRVLGSLEGQSLELQQCVQQLAQREQAWCDQQLQPQNQNLTRSLGQASETCQQSQKDLSLQSDGFLEQTRIRKTAMQEVHGRLGGAFSAAAELRSNYQSETQSHNSRAHRFQDEVRERLGSELQRVGAASQQAGQQVKALEQGLDSFLQDSLTPAGRAVGLWLQQDMKQKVTGMVGQRLEVTLGALGAFRGGVQTVSSDLQQTVAGLHAVVGNLARQLPETVKTRGVNPVIQLGKDLAVNQVVETLSTIMVGSGMSAACVGVMPVLKIVAVTLRAMLAVSSVAATGALPKDNAADYEDAPLKAGALGVGAGARSQGVLGAVEQMVDSLDAGLAEVEKTAAAAWEGTLDLANQGAQKAQEFVHKLFCPLCGAECQVVHGLG